MTHLIETLDGGEIRTGFYGPDVSKIRLGDLPPITTQQFVGYAALTLSEQIIPYLDRQQRDEWAESAHYIQDEVKDLQETKISGKFFGQSVGQMAAQAETVPEEDKTELMESLVAGASPTDAAEYYKNSPFKVSSDGRQVGFVDGQGEVKHVVAAEDFFTLVSNVIGGGFLGWRKTTYPEVKEAAAKLSTTFAEYGSPAPSAIPPANPEIPSGAQSSSANIAATDDEITEAIRKIIDDTM